MPKYLITYCVKTEYAELIEAASEDEAWEKADRAVLENYSIAPPDSAEEVDFIACEVFNVEQQENQ